MQQEPLKRVHLSFLKWTLSVKRTTSNPTVWGDTGRFLKVIELIGQPKATGIGYTEWKRTAASPLPGMRSMSNVTWNLINYIISNSGILKEEKNRKLPSTCLVSSKIITFSQQHLDWNETKYAPIFLCSVVQGVVQGVVHCTGCWTGCWTVLHKLRYCWTWFSWTHVIRTLRRHKFSQNLNMSLFKHTASRFSECKIILGQLHIDCHVGNKTTIVAQKYFKFLSWCSITHSLSNDNPTVY